MTKGFTVERQFDVRRGRNNRGQLRKGEANTAISGRVPRISRLMALAIRFDHLIQSGVVADQAELARLGRVIRARLTQIINLLNLAPNIQADILNMATTEPGRDRLSERQLRPIAAIVDWSKQRRLWLDALRSRI